jgi:myo-inositol-1(or 4)-monophosphatase
MSTIKITQLCDLVKSVCRKELYTRIDQRAHSIKADGSLLTELDLALNDGIRDALAERYPATAFLSEEMPVEQQQQVLDSEEPYWCLDPLDGTSNFVAGIPYFCVSLALVENGKPSHGIVYDPARDEMFAAAYGKGATLNGEKLAPREVNLTLQQCMAVIDLKRLNKTFQSAIIQSPPFCSHRNFGASALEWSWLAAGRGHVYLHGGQKLWDHAAGFLIFNEAGGHARTMEGEIVFNNTLESRSVVASLDNGLFQDWAAWVKKIAAQ